MVTCCLSDLQVPTKHLTLQFFSKHLVHSPLLKVSVPLLELYFYCVTTCVNMLCLKKSPFLIFFSHSCNSRTCTVACRVATWSLFPILHRQWAVTLVVDTRVTTPLTSSTLLAAITVVQPGCPLLTLPLLLPHLLTEA